MTEQEKHIDYLEKYFAGEADEDKRIAFEKKIEESEEFRMAAQNYKLAKQSILDHGLKSKLQDFHEKLIEKPAVHHWKKWKIPFGIAASIFFIILFYVFPKSPDGEQLFDEYYSPFSVPTVRGSSDERYLLFKTGKYGQTLDALREIKNPTSLDQLLIANCHLELQQYDAASIIFKNLQEDGSMQLSQHATWYLGLMYIKVGDHERALLELKKLSANSMYSMEAKELIRRLL